jgi:hypothetical protein
MSCRTLLAATSALGVLLLSSAPARAEHRQAIARTGIVYELRTATERLHESADRDLRFHGPRGRAKADTLHRMDQWAGYYLKAVERHGFRSRMARQRFHRFLTEYRAACGFLDRGRPRGEVAVLHAAVSQLSDAYGFHGWWEEDRWKDERSRRARW